MNRLVKLQREDGLDKFGRPRRVTLHGSMRHRPEDAEKIDAEALKLAKFDGQKIGEWLRECVELRVEGRR